MSSSTFFGQLEGGERMGGLLFLLVGERESMKGKRGEDGDLFTPAVRGKMRKDPIVLLAEANKQHGGRGGERGGVSPEGRGCDASPASEEEEKLGKKGGEKPLLCRGEKRGGGTTILFRCERGRSQAREKKAVSPFLPPYFRKKEGALGGEEGASRGGKKGGERGANA